MFINFLFETITMQCALCGLVMALCHKDKHILYFQCKHETCVTAGMKCNYCNVIKLSTKGCIKNIKYSMLKHYKHEHLSSPHISSTIINSVQNMIECNSTTSTKSKSKSNESTTIISSSFCVDSYSNTY